MTQPSKKRLGLLAISLLFSLLAVIVAYALADGYIDRLPNHKGYYLVPVENDVQSQPQQKPRRTIFVLVDGLGQQFAQGMTSMKKLAEIGQCRSTNTGALTISRPVYTIVSSGVEVDRTGARNNDETSPVAVQSIWQVASKRGLSLHAASDLLWWDQLFPNTFSTYLHEPDTNLNLFDNLALGDLNVIHPSRVDSAGHKYGADSQEYRDAVVRTDEELSSFINTLDLSKDLLIVTADHGHSNSGGHGGPAGEISNVLTCFAGPSILATGPSSAIDVKTIAPTIAVLLGLPFPKHMRAVEDSLDEIWTIADKDRLGRSYSLERKKHIETFRQSNREQLGKWLGKPEGRWSELYERERRHQRNWWLGTAAVGLLLLLLGYRIRRFSLRQSAFSVVWMAGLTLAISLAYTVVRGSFDFTSINLRNEFLVASLSVSLSLSVLAMALHFYLWRKLSDVLLDLLTLIAILLLVGLMHRVVYGVPLAFPLPGPKMLFWPFLHGAIGISLGLLSGLLSLFLIVNEIRVPSSPQ